MATPKTNKEAIRWVADHTNQDNPAEAWLWFVAYQIAAEQGERSHKDHAEDVIAGAPPLRPEGCQEWLACWEDEEGHILGLLREFFATK